MTRFAVNTGLVAAFDAAARVYAADPTNDTKKTAATDAYALAYPTGGVFFAMSPAGVATDDHDDVTGAGVTVPSSTKPKPCCSSSASRSPLRS